MKKTLWFFAAALAALGAVFWGMERRERAGARSPSGFVDARPDDLVRLRVDYLGDSVTLIREGRRWMTTGDRFPADTARLRRVLDGVLGLQRRETVSAEGVTDADLAPYGLDSASARRVEWTLASGEVIRVLLGRTSGIDFGSVFWKPAGEPGAWRTPGTFVWDVSSRPKDWKDTTLFPRFAPEDIARLDVEWREPDGASVRYVVTRDGDSDSAFRVEDPGAGRIEPARRDAAAALFTHAAQFKIDDFLSGFDAAAAGAALDAPVMIVRIGLKSGVTHVVTAGAPVDGLYRYIRHPTHPDPVRVFAWRFKYFRKRAGELQE